MGTVPHHQAKAAEYLQHADRAIADRDPPQAAVVLRRAFTHSLTAVAIHDGLRHKSRRQLKHVLDSNVFKQCLSHDHLRTFRQVHSLPDHLLSRPRYADAAATLRRMRRRVASFISDCAAVIAGQPKPVRYHKRWLRYPNLPATPTFDTVQDILSLPNYEDIKTRFRLFSAPLAASPDPHGWYQGGLTPRPCSCHQELWDRPQDESVISLSPFWRRALEKTFRIKLPQDLQLRV